MSKAGSGSGSGRGSGERRGLESVMAGLKLGSGAGSVRGGGRQSVFDDFTRTRPDTLAEKTGFTGTPVVLKANFAKMTKHLRSVESMENVLIYQYHVSFEPSVDSKRMKMQLLDAEHEKLGVVPPLVFDGMILYLPRVLAFNKLITRHPNTGEEILIKLEKTADLIPMDPQCTTFLNVMNRRIQEVLGLVQINRHFFDRSQAVAVARHGMEIWPGTSSAIRRYEDDLLMNIDVIHKMLRRDSVLTFLEEHLRNGARGKETGTKELIGTSILTKYNNKLYRVDDIYWDKHPETTTFEKQDGTRITLVQYMKEQYNEDVKTMGQPVLMSRAKKRGLDGNANADVLLIPELCYMTGLTERMRADTQVMKDVAAKTRIGPQKRVESAEALCREINKNPRAQELLRSWDLEIEPELVRVTGRVLPSEKLYFADGRETSIDSRKGEWSRECRGKKPVRGVHLEEQSWAMVFPDRLYGDAEKLFKTIQSEGPGLGVNVGVPVLKRLEDDREASYVDACRQAAKLSNAKIILALVPNDNKQRYDAIKKTCCNECPVPCQVVQLSTVKRENILRSICQKIIAQMTCKMGGALWKLKIPMKRVMVAGYDSYTDSSMKGKAVGAAVFSVNDDLTMWRSEANVHENINQESRNIANYLEKALLKYRALWGALPERIFFYRSGVGEGAIPVVFNMELELVHSALAKVYGPGAEDRGEVKLAFTIVNKKINSRFFAELPGGRYENPAPGTVVDTVCTRVERYDYFLIPQAVNQGSVTPVAYNVIFDNSGLKLVLPPTPEDGCSSQADQMQRLSYKLCHLYYNWQGTIRVPAPCQYAHKLAFLVSQSTHAPAHEALTDSLFFL